MQRSVGPSFSANKSEPRMGSLYFWSVATMRLEGHHCHLSYKLYACAIVPKLSNVTSLLKSLNLGRYKQVSILLSYKH